jgi:transcriptional regulator GlxA family with amidase domain
MDARVQRTIDMMHRRVTDQVSIARLSAEVGLSPGRLRHLFRQETGQSPMRYFRYLRIQRAEELLRNSFLSIKEVAFRSGARDVSHFVRDFKKQYGITPSDFRIKVQQPSQYVCTEKVVK